MLRLDVLFVIITGKILSCSCFLSFVSILPKNSSEQLILSIEKKRKKKGSKEIRRVTNLPEKRIHALKRDTRANFCRSRNTGLSVNISQPLPEHGFNEGGRKERERERERESKGGKERQSACHLETNSSRWIFACDTMPECGTSRCSTPIPFSFFYARFIYPAQLNRPEPGNPFKAIFRRPRRPDSSKVERVLMKISTTERGYGSGLTDAERSSATSSFVNYSN